MGERELARRVGISQSSICRIVKENKFHRYHITLVQELKETDYPKRLNFCRFVLEQTILDQIFLENVLFGDEASFSKNGVVNKHNCHCYAQDNRRWIREGHFQRVYSTNAWCGILGNKIIGPYFFCEKLNGQVYLNFLRNILPMFDEVALQRRRSMRKEWWTAF